MRANTNVNISVVISVSVSESVRVRVSVDAREGATVYVPAFDSACERKGACVCVSLETSVCV